MIVDVDPGWVLSVFFTALRVGVLLMMSPMFTGLSGLVTLRVLLTLVLSAVLVAGLEPARPAVMPELGLILVAAAGEVAVGAVLAFGVFAAFGAFSVAGKVLDIQSGFGMGAVYDPVTNAGAAVFSTMLSMAAVVVFFALDAHHAFLRGIAFSLEQVAPGAGLRELDMEAVLRQFGLMFSLGVALIMPVMLCLLLVEVGLAVISRVLPQMNVFFVLVPIKLVTSLCIFAITVTVLAPPMAQVYAAIFDYWEQVLD